MNERWCGALVGALGLGLLLAAGPRGRGEGPPPPPPPEENNVEAPPGVEVQARGPVHEAYAEPSEAQPHPGAVIAKEPPAPVEEAPSEDRPAGEGVVWVPGYWGWDDERADFLWVSGFWRVAPPGRQWVPGNWQQVAGGWQWTGGCWMAAGTADVHYLPPPPAPVEEPAPPPPPAANSTYVPGCWVWRETRYLWRPSYYVAYRPDWVWSPPRCVSTAAGCIFVAGYWDHPLHTRGVLYAPVYFQRRLLRPGFVYRPSFCVQPDFLLGAMFVRTNTRRYYFGDYFEARYRGAYVPWVDYRVRRVAYDVNYSYYRHAFAGHAGWERGLRTLYADRYAGTVARPPRTWAQQRVVVNNITVNRTANVMVNRSVNITHLQNVRALTPVARGRQVQVTGLSSLAGIRPGVKAPLVHREVRFERLSRERVVEAQSSVAHFRAVQTQRQTLQAGLLAKGPPPMAARTVRFAALAAPPAHHARAAFKPPPPPSRPAPVVRPPHRP